MKGKKKQNPKTRKKSERHLKHSIEKTAGKHSRAPAAQPTHEFEKTESVSTIVPSEIIHFSPTNGRQTRDLSRGRGFQSHSIPPEISQYIKGRVVNLWRASTYYRKCWEAICPRVHSELKREGESQYKLSHPFFRFFLKHLREKVAGHYGKSEMGPTDVIALALYEAGCLYGQTPMPAHPSPFQPWPEGRPVSEAWKGLGDLPIPGDFLIVYEYPGPGHELRVPRPGQFQHPRIAVRVSYSMDKEKLPKLTIEIEGEPVCLLMKAAYELNDLEQRRAVRKEVDRILTSLLRRLFVKALPKGGRPPEHRAGRKAAFLHYHRGLAWPDVAEQLCKQNHAHTKACSKNFQTQATQFWQAVRQGARRYPLAKA